MACWGQPAPSAPVITGNLPGNVQIPSGITTPEQARPFFDYFSWESLIGLNWPTTGYCVPNQPNNSSVFLQARNGSATVWTSYKNSSALFGQGNHRPPAWDSDALPVNPCAKAKPDAAALFVAAKGGELLNAPPNEAFSVPLIDQNNNYAYFAILFNQDQYNFHPGKRFQPGYLVISGEKPGGIRASNYAYPDGELSGQRIRSGRHYVEGRMAADDREGPRLFGRKPGTRK